MITAYETEGHGVYWQVYLSENDEETFLAEVDTLDEVMAIGKEGKTEIRLFTQEWYINLENEIREKKDERNNL
jgi:hypothetical protein